MSALRKKLHSLIDEIPDQSLPILKPLLTHLATETDDWEVVIEPANAKEAAMIDKIANEFEKDPTSFIPYDRSRYTS